MYSEPVINLNSRIRYLRQDQDGTLYAKSDPNLFYVLQLDWPGVRRNDPKIDHDAVILTKIEQCAGCHKPHEAHGIIPNIYGKNAAELRASLLRLAVANVGDEAMRSIAKSLTAEELDRIPVYFSTH
jgi:hypothetical protein